MAVVALMEVTVTKRKKGQASHGMMWSTIAVIIITIIIGVILPQGPITQMFGM